MPDGETAQEGVAQGDPGRPAGREIEFAEVLRDAHAHGVTGIVMLTADVHYTAAHHYDPARGSAGEFTPFWDFVSGPLNAGAFGPNALDPTFGPEAVFVSAPPVANTGPWGGFQFFGEVAIDGATRVMTVACATSTGTSSSSPTSSPPGRPGNARNPPQVVAPTSDDLGCSS